MLKLNMQKARREAAKSFYTTLLSELDGMEKSLKTQKTMEKSPIKQLSWALFLGASVNEKM